MTALEMAVLNIDSKCSLVTHQLGVGFLCRSNAGIRAGVRFFADFCLVLSAFAAFSDAL
jgi:hypothetical protein